MAVKYSKYKGYTENEKIQYITNVVDDIIPQIMNLSPIEGTRIFLPEGEIK